MNISRNGTLLIEELEGFKPKPYNDAGNNATVGYGTLLHRGPVNPKVWPLDGRYLEKGISRPEAEFLLGLHVRASVEPPINSMVKVHLEQYQFDALCSFVYNLGSGALQHSTLLTLLNLKKYEAVPDEMRKWNHVNGEVNDGLINRREKEVAMWNGQWLPTSDV